MLLMRPGTLAWIVVVGGPLVAAERCPPNPDPAEAFATSDVVFSGIVTGNKTFGNRLVFESDDSFRIEDNGVRATIQVEQVWKGMLHEIVTLEQYSSATYIHLGIGDIFLVYARRDGSALTTNNCSRTARISAAGEDLAYLYYVKRNPAASTRLFGFITTAMGDIVNQQPVREASQPVANLIVRLESAAGRKSSTTDQRGRFALDGLAEGEYALTIYDGEYPERERILKGPVKLHVPATGFARHDIYILPELLKKP